MAATLYDVLGITSATPPSEVRSAFKQRALVLHPDKGGSKEAFQQVLLAFEVLSDPEEPCGLRAQAVGWRTRAGRARIQQCCSNGFSHPAAIMCPAAPDGDRLQRKEEEEVAEEE